MISFVIEQFCKNIEMDFNENILLRLNNFTNHLTKS
jgi:hypothetical protein